MFERIGFALVMFTMATLAGGEVVVKEIDYTHDGVALRGVLAYDDASDDPRPGVLVVPEWWGVEDYARSRARQVAELGYVAFVADMYGDGKSTDDPKQAGAWATEVRGDRKLMRGRAMAAIDTLKKQPQVDGERLAAIGYCFGGTTVLELARANAPVRGVVSFHGGLGSPMPAEAAIKPSVLVLHGAVDPMVPPEEVAAFQKEMEAAKADYVLVAFADSVHSFTNPASDRRSIPGIAYNERADARSWAAMRMFLDELFAG